MHLGRLSSGEKISSVSAILLFLLTFFHWFGVKAVNTSDLLFAIQAVGPGRSAWEALDCIPIFLVITIVVTFAVAASRLTNPTRSPSIPLNMLVAVLGIASVLMILYRIIAPPVFSIEPTITYEGAAQSPIFLALFAAAGVAIGGFWAMWEVRHPLLQSTGGHEVDQALG